jgi:mevalonate kinase
MRSGEIAEMGRLMTLNHNYLQQLTVSSNELDQLVNAAIQSGALGAKLSGGGRGGNMIALVTHETASTVESALRESGAVRIYHNLVGAF